MLIVIHFNLSRSFFYSSGFQPWDATPVWVVCLFLGAAKASYEKNHVYFYTLYFVRGTTLCHSKNNRIIWQK